MHIDIVQGHTPPANPSGITVVIDVIRAFTTAHEAFARGARRIFPVATANEAFALREAHPQALLVGEIEALPIKGFDHGNSPWEIRQADVRGRTLIQRTTNGVTAALAARASREVLVAALVNAEATAEYLRAASPTTVVLVASHPTGDEDVACAEYIRALLGGDGITLDEARRRTRGAAAARKFLDGSHPRLHSLDIDLATRVDRRGQVMRLHFEPLPEIRAVPT